jgi:hypothetical protein
MYVKKTKICDLYGGSAITNTDFLIKIRLSTLEDQIEAGLIKGSIGPEYIDCLLSLVMREIRQNLIIEHKLFEKYELSKID